MELLDLPPEILQQIFKNFSDVKTISSILLIGNHFLTYLVNNYISTIKGDSVSFTFIKKMHGLKRILDSSISIDSNTELEELAIMPKLRFVQPIMLNFVKNIPEFLDAVLRFATKYSSTPKKSLKRLICIKIKLSDLRLIFQLNEGIYFFRYGNPIRNLEGEKFLSFLIEYNKVLPIQAINTNLIANSTSFVSSNSFHKVLKIFKNMSNLNSLYLGIGTSLDFIVANALKDQIVKIRSNIDVSLFVGFDVNPSVKIFINQIRPCDVDTVLLIFPKVEEIVIQGDIEEKVPIGKRNYITYKGPANYLDLKRISEIPQLKIIYLKTHFPGLVPKSSKFRVVNLEKLEYE